MEAVFTGKERLYNRRFLQMCGHYLVQPVACTPASGREKGQVENQVGLVRERFFTPRLRVKSFEELNAWLLDKCVAYAKAHRHPSRRIGLYGKCSRRSARASCPTQDLSMASTAFRPARPLFSNQWRTRSRMAKTCTVRFDNNKYSVISTAVGRPVDVHAYADRIVIRQDGNVVAEHARIFGRGQTAYDPWHYVPVLARKPGALRNGAPFKDWVLPRRWPRSGAS